jgi:hypothetical protein
MSERSAFETQVRFVAQLVRSNFDAPTRVVQKKTIFRSSYDKNKKELVTRYRKARCS